MQYGSTELNHFAFWQQIEFCLNRPSLLLTLFINVNCCECVYVQCLLYVACKLMEIVVCQRFANGKKTSVKCSFERNLLLIWKT